ncbi:pentatricopeptide repeat-containing protein At1g07740, mitochondrial [Pistacia vera]|uniref:pentatricopeptide repeat-containing protein At1g07740, mitochondrial n=1 Tax=Pistacia vera TaxID=55513 RepID=UPI00126355F4|nr:pentatricopeptide repeat-containing protein At1g07740, mitochondrial [Pistacia vera]
MIPSRSKALNNQTQALIFHQCINHIHSHQNHTLVRNKPKTKTRRRIQQPLKITPRPRNPIPFVTNLKQIHDPEEALSLFHEYHQMGSKHDYPSYASLIYKLARARDFEAVETVLGYIQDYNIRCKEILFIALIQHYGKAHLVDKAIELFHKITSFDCVRTLQSLNTLLNVLIDNDRLHDAKEMFGSFHKMGLRPNSVSFNIMIKGWLKEDNWVEARRVFDKMLERKVQPSVVTYNSLIGFLCRKGDVEKAKGLFEDIVKKGKYPNAVTYALLMEGLCSIGEFKEAKKMMFDMAYRGCKPKLINFGVLMTDLGKRGKIDEAKSLLGEMKKRRFKPDVVIYNILINYLCKEGRTTEAYKVFVEMQVGGCEPNAATYRMMADGFCRVEDFEGGLKVFNAMLTSRHCPRLETFRCLIEGLLKCGKIDGACFFLEEMEKRKMRLDLNAWEALVRDACVGDESVDGLVSELVYAH